MSRHAPSKIRPGWQEERRLLTRVKSEDEKALARFTQEHGARLYRLAFRLVGDEERALQILMSGLTKALKRSAFREENEELGAWLTGFILREAMPAPARKNSSTIPALGTSGRAEGGPAERGHKGRGRRGRSSRQETASPAQPVQTAAEPAPVVDWSPLLENEESRHELRRRLQLAAAKLPTELRSAWVLMDAEGRNVEQSAAAMELDQSIALSRLHRARMHLCVALAPGAGDGKAAS